jgi:hypothetical protein
MIQANKVLSDRIQFKGLSTKADYCFIHTNNIDFANLVNLILFTPDNYKLSKNLERIDEFALLEQNWNDNDAVPFNKNLLNRVRAIICDLDIQPEVFPTAAESIQIEYEIKGKYLEFEIFEDAIMMFKVSADGTEVEKEIEQNEIKTIVQEFYNE